MDILSMNIFKPDYQLGGTFSKNRMIHNHVCFVKVRTTKLGGTQIDKAESLEVHSKTLTQAGKE